MTRVSTGMGTEMKQRAIIVWIRYFFGIIALTILWMVLSHVVVLWLAAADDNTNMEAPLPYGLQFACKIAFFPTNCFQRYSLADKLVYKDTIQIPSGSGMLIDSLFWALLAVVVFSFVARLFKRQGVREIATFC